MPGTILRDTTPCNSVGVSNKEILLYVHCDVYDLGSLQSIEKALFASKNFLLSV